MGMMMHRRRGQNRIGGWVAPAWADTLKNPVAGQESAAIAGKKIFSSYCVACHGTGGEGNGPAATGLNPSPANLTLPRVQNQSDGAIFWKISTGRNGMAPYKESLSARQRWALVDFIRSLVNK
jgi:mono/diheme cytochrome c family protein